MRVLKEVLGDNHSIYQSQIKPGPKTKFTDLEVIALSLTFQFLGYNSESFFFNQINKVDFPDLLSRRQYNDRCKLLLHHIENIRTLVSSKTIPDEENKFAIDSMPLKVCRFARRFRNKIGKEKEETNPDVGFCAAQGERYYGYKLHVVCSSAGVIKTVDISAASVHDINYLKDVNYNLKNCDLIGDKGYVSQYYKEKLWTDSKIRLCTEYRKNQKIVELMSPGYKRIRKRVETIFSQLNDQFNIQRNYTKTFRGYVTRILSKITSMTVINYINLHINNVAPSKIKYALA